MEAVRLQQNASTPEPRHEILDVKVSHFERFSIGRADRKSRLRAAFL